jgi:hypothetical protein
VFELSQTEPVPAAEQVSLEPPSEPLSGDSHRHLLEPLRDFAQSLGYSVCFQEIPGSAQDWCETRAKQIVIDSKMPANAQVRTLIHECAHAMGVDYERYSRAQAEVIVAQERLSAFRIGRRRCPIATRPSEARCGGGRVGVLAPASDTPRPL